MDAQLTDTRTDWLCITERASAHTQHARRNHGAPDFVFE